MSFRFYAVAVLCSLAFSGAAFAEKTDDVMKLARGRLTLQVPAKWQRKQPKVRIIEHEFAIKAVDGDSEDVRVTVMGAGGSVSANVSRWMSQFRQAGGAAVTSDQIKHEEKKIGGATVHVVDVSGTYLHRAAPFAGGRTTEKKGFRMLGAIIVTEKSGQYFIKAIGPAKTVAAGKKDLEKMLDGLKLSE